MAAIDGFQIPSIGGDIHVDRIKRAFAEQAWAWYNANQNMSIPVHVWIIRSSVKLSQLRFVFETVFGPEMQTG